MLYITTPFVGYNGLVSHHDHDWHLGKKQPLNCFDTVVSVQADGDELEYILKAFTGIPMCKNHVQTWYGDDAKFIAQHLPYK